MHGNTLQARTVLPFISPEWWETLGVVGWIYAMGILLLFIMIGSIFAAVWSVDGSHDARKIRPNRKKPMARRLLKQDGTFLAYKGGDDGLDDWASVEQRLINEGINISTSAAALPGNCRMRNRKLVEEQLGTAAQQQQQQHVRRYVEESDDD
jgi:hypothetical protein